MSNPQAITSGSVTTTLIVMASALGLVAILSACHDRSGRGDLNEGLRPDGVGAVSASAPDEASPGQEDSTAVVVSEEPLAAIPSMPISQLLGRARADIETLFTPSPPDPEPGWVRYSRHLIVRYEGDAAVELVELVPGGLDCLGAARWMGFGGAASPLRRRDRCLWPPGSDRHRLGDGVSGELLLEGGRFTARLDSALGGQ